MAPKGYSTKTRVARKLGITLKGGAGEINGVLWNVVANSQEEGRGLRRHSGVLVV
jgi:hypothetical protein